MATFSPEVIRLAQETQAKYGVPASVTLAQYATESGYGKSWLARNANNYFGMIGSYNGQKVYKTDRYWRKYSSMEESFNDHGRLLSSGRYAQATKGVTSADAYIDAIQPIYAPESDGNHGISQLWKTIIKQNNLTQYDTGNFVSPGSGSTDSGTGSAPSGVAGKVENIGYSILGGIIKAGAVILLCVVAVVLFFNAFDLDLPTPTTIAKKAVKE